MKPTLFPPALVFYTDKGHDWQAGIERGPVVTILPKYKDDKGLLAHELCHVAVFWVVTLLAGVLLCVYAPQELMLLALSVKPLLYRLIPAWRLAEEVWCYRVQMKAYDDGRDRTHHFAKFLATRYGLGITVEEADKRLRDKT